MCLIGGEGEENMGGGGITPISVTPKLSCRSPEKDDIVKIKMKRRTLYSPLCWVWPLGVTLSFGSIERGLTASVTENISVNFFFVKFLFDKVQ